MLTHAICLRSGLDSVHCLWLDQGERCLTALPLFHVNAQAMSLFASMTVGGTLILVEEFRASRFWGQVRAHRATHTAIVAMQLRTMLARPADPDERDHQLRRVFYAINVTDGEKDAFEERFGVTLINGYGLSEAMTLLLDRAGPRPAPLAVDRAPVAGPPAASSSTRTATSCRPARSGRSPSWVHPAATSCSATTRTRSRPRGAFRDGRMHTGDNAYADDEGYLYFFDRKKDMIKRAGENVSAIEVEGAISEHPKVAEACVVGIPDPIRDEAVAAVVVLIEPDSMTEDEILEHCRGRLSKFKVPTVVRFTTELPKTSIGKVRKDEVRKSLDGVEVPTR